MEPRTRLVITLILALGLALPLGVEAAVVGRVSQIEGRVDILKGGKLPATPAQLEAELESGDVIRTKTASKAQVRFADDSLLTIGPSSRVAIEDYLYDASQGKRRAVLKVFRGLVHAVVSRVFKTKEPDFIMKTNTATIGVRGTDWYAQLIPLGTDIYNKSGKTCVRNIYPEIKGEVCLGEMEYSRVGADLPPTLPMTITSEDLLLLENMLNLKTKPMVRADTYQSGEFREASAAGTPGVVSREMFETNQVDNLATALFVPPTVTAASQPSPPPPPVFLTFTQTYSGTYVKPSSPPYKVATYNSGSPGFGTRTGVYPGSFTANYSITATITTAGQFSPYSSGSFTVQRCSGRVNGPPGGVLKGTMNMTAVTGGGTRFTFSGPVTVHPSGNLTFVPLGAFDIGQISGTTTGTWTQTPTQPAAQ